MMENLLNALPQALARSIDYFLGAQSAQGYWAGELESNASITAEYLFFRRLIGRADAETEQQIVRYLLKGQSKGGWPLFYDGPPDLNATLEAAVALQMAGLPLNSQPLQEATATVLALGGLEGVRVFTRIWLAMLGAISWDSVPAMPPEMMLLPDSIPLNVYRFASWARGTLVPLLLVMNRPPRYPGTPPRVDHFYSGRPPAAPAPGFDARSAFRLLDWLLKRSEFLLKRSPLRPRAIEAARRWILEHQEANGGWGGIQPAMVYSTLALGQFPEDRAAAERGVQAMHSFSMLDEGGFRMQSCVSPGWDTPWVLLALSEAGLQPGHPALQRGRQWLAGQQSAVVGDWAVRAPGVPAGGWPFEFYNAQYPDTDDTALVLMAFHSTGVPVEQDFSSGLGWMLGMQNEDGGWAAFDRHNDTRLVEQIPFCDFGEVLDPSSADVTAHVLELLGRLGYDSGEIHVRRGLDYLWKEQEADGAWFGRWGVNYIYGTSAVLMALAALGFGPNDRRVARAANWLRAHQNEDGSWGESCLSYTDPAWRGRGVGTASQTAWAVLGLLAAGGQDDRALQGGLRWLLERQNQDGTWEEPYFTGTGFPGDFYINYHEYRNYFPALALARAMSAFHLELPAGALHSQNV